MFDPGHTRWSKVQNAQNPPPAPSSEHSEQFEQHSDGASAGLSSWSEAEDERAAIIELDGGIPRAWAEGFARLNPDRAPADMPLRRWRRFVDEVGLSSIVHSAPWQAAASAIASRTP
jgi:hypothetical protein